MKIIRMTKGDWGKIRAFFDLETSEGFTIKGFKLVEAIDGNLFVGFPSQKKDDEYADTVYAPKGLKDEVGGLAHNEYHAQNQDPAMEKNDKRETVGVAEDDDIPF